MKVNEVPTLTERKTERKDGKHTHVCNPCPKSPTGQTIWEHGNGGDHVPELYDAAHLCPNCGANIRLGDHSAQAPKPNIEHPVKLPLDLPIFRRRQSDELAQLLAMFQDIAGGAQ